MTRPDCVQGQVIAIEYDPNRSARIALIEYADKERRYIVAPTGLKVGAALAATAAVVAEFVASDKGLGYLLLQYNGNLDTPMVFATIILLSLIGLAVYYVVELIERFTIPWHVSQRPAGDEAIA